MSARIRSRADQSKLPEPLLDLFLSKQPSLIQMAARITGCRCLAEDIVQETILKICETGVDENVRSPAAYLVRMVRNLSIDCARRRAREQCFTTLEEGAAHIKAPCPCLETRMERCQALRIVMNAMIELPERTRHVFEMHRIDGVSQRDIAAQLGVSPTLVNFMVRDAHNHCRSKLMSHEIEGEMVPPPAGRPVHISLNGKSRGKGPGKPKRRRAVSQPMALPLQKTNGLAAAAPQAAR